MFPVDGERVQLPDTFDKIPETLNTASKKDIVSRIERATTVREWAERMAADEDS
ncbi:hypothetical protein [Streptomyces sp. WZ-12]|uniref:hypothetical protein n=1 Tax=Streptomyces sp. WZ-12 TaxID=3030210 RepID=UPI002380EAB8|nr:hypothetical protein [Streptomyces sp. WZ-12]